MHYHLEKFCCCCLMSCFFINAPFSHNVLSIYSFIKYLLYRLCWLKALIQELEIQSQMKLSCCLRETVTMEELPFEHILEEIWALGHPPHGCPPLPRAARPASRFEGWGDVSSGQRAGCLLQWEETQAHRPSAVWLPTVYNTRWAHVALFPRDAEAREPTQRDAPAAAPWQRPPSVSQGPHVFL